MHFLKFLDLHPPLTQHQRTVEIVQLVKQLIMNWLNWVTLQAWKRISGHYMQNYSAPTHTIQWLMGGSSPEVKRSEREAHHSSPSMQFNNA
jgi:hypothetical protein